MPTKREMYIIDVATHYGLNPEIIDKLIENGLLANAGADEDFFTDDDFELLRRVCRLQNSLGINLEGIAVVVQMRDQIIKLQNEIHEMKQIMHHQTQNRFFIDIE